ncbi:TRAP transporter small permease [Marinobacterium arenosum]|uniref:TRAP transporter small permease n=1 Tax=Marinobacterium arenosum TaxID=2862496 RepID=UPI001C97B9A0|nr:TRAP transporter small permease [Marinobacterium arenosum]MBY4678368.1 TRAP transporter small permease [Marinobacterium arenosum]
MTIEYTHPDDLIGPSHVKPVPPLPYAAKSLFFRAEHWLAQLIAALMVASTLLLGLLMASQVLMRYGLESPFLGIEELAPMLALWAYFMGMVYATRDQDHISGGVVALLIRNRSLIRAIRLAGSLACLVATGIFGYYAWDFASFNLDLGRKSLYMRWPKYLWDFSMVSGFTLMGFYYCLQIIAEARDLTMAKGNKK